MNLMKAQKIFFLLTAVVFAVNCYSQNNRYIITDFGAKADGITNNAASIQKAIDAAANNGGGIVVIPPGNFVSGAIELKSNINLYLEAGARIAGSVNMADYNSRIALAVIVAKNCENISITGYGEIDGRAPELVANLFEKLQNGSLTDPQWKFKRPAETSRPMILRIINCKNVAVKNITLKNSAGWVQDYRGCSNLVIDSLKVQSTAYWNNDGIDVTDCKKVKISNCFVNSGDDGICLKSEDSASYCEDVVVENCKIRASANAFKLGTASCGGFRDIRVSGLEIYDTYRSAVAIECVDGGKIEDINIRNISAKNTGNAIFIRLGQRSGAVPGQIENVKISDLTAEIPLRKPDLGYPFEGPPDYLRYRYNVSSKNRPAMGYPFVGQPIFPYNLIPSSIVGIPGANIKNITLEDIKIDFYGASDKKVAYIGPDSLQKVPEKTDDYPEFSMFGELPAWAFYVRHAEGIKMKDVKVSYREFDFRPAMVFDDARDIELCDVNIASGSEIPIVLFNNTKSKEIKNLKLPVNGKNAILDK